MKLTITDNGHGQDITAATETCAKCGERPGVVPVHGCPGSRVYWCAECAAPPQWTTKPPTEPGKWFWRFVGEFETHICELEEPSEDDYPFDFEDPAHPREWWPVRIQEPPR